jgi:hypothetical protein
MSEFVNKILTALEAYPILHVVSVAVVGILSVLFWRRGEKDGKSMNHIEIPMFLVGGPVADFMREMLHQTRLQTQLLEDMRNNQEMRGDPQPPPTQHRKRGP